MGGGISNLFYGTKGSQQEYQFTLFEPFETASISHDSKVASGLSQNNIQSILISVKTVLLKCSEYHDHKITAKQLTQWLFCIIKNPIYKVSRKLRGAIKDGLLNFEKCLLESREDYDAKAFGIALTIFESQLHQL